MRSDTDLNQFMVADKAALIASGTAWVRFTGKAALAEALKAGNPTTYSIGVNGKTSATGFMRMGFKPGSIDQAISSVRVEFIGTALADVANGLRPILADVIAAAFPNSPTGALKGGWSWWIQKGRNAKPANKNTKSTRLGGSVPDTVTIYDVLWLVPDANSARYAWIANRNAYKFLSSNVTKKRATGQFKATRKIRGYLATATRKMRGARVPGITIQGWFVRKHMTGPFARTRKGKPWKQGVPAIRVGFKSGLSADVSN